MIESATRESHTSVEAQFFSGIRYRTAARTAREKKGKSNYPKSVSLFYLFALSGVFMATHILQVAYYRPLRELRAHALETAGYCVTSVLGKWASPLNIPFEPR